MINRCTEAFTNLFNPSIMSTVEDRMIVAIVVVACITFVLALSRRK